ncbi:MAG: acyltransferase [Pseudomonadota bacterium]
MTTAGYFKLDLKPGAFPALDGLRALAILLVLARHAATALPSPDAGLAPPLRWLYNLALNGWLGVDLFFVLSGCLIATHLLRWQQFSTHPYRFKTYLLKRICRTFPLYYAIIALILLGLVPYYQADPVSSFDLLVLLLFVQDYFGAQLLVPLWSLAVEEKFYLLAPGLIFGLYRYVRPRQAIALLLLLSLLPPALRMAALTTPPDDYADFFWRVRAPFSLEALLFGVLCALLTPHLAARDFVRRHQRALMWTGTALLVVLLCARPWAETGDWTVCALLIYAAAALFGCLVYLAIAAPRAQSGVLAGAPLRVISKLSYALYLTHYTMIPAAARAAGALVGAASGIMYGTAFLLCYLVFSFAFSVLLHFIVEKPFLLLKERFR